MTRVSILAALRSTHDALDPLDGGGDLTAAQLELGLALLEHEVQHHGQLIRFVHGNDLTFPQSWHDRYTVG